MGIADDWRYRNRLRSLLFCLMVGSFWFQSSCVTLLPGSKTTQPVVSEKGPTKQWVFRSDEYIVYRLRGGETPVTMAKRFFGDPKRSWIIEDANEGVPFEKNKMIVIPLDEANRGGLKADGYQLVSVLSYHHFAKDCTSIFCIPSAVFDQQMRYLGDNGYRVISMDELLGFLQYRHALPKRSVVITIDDGYRSAYDIAYRILKKYGFTATLFIYTDFVGISKRAITWSQLRKMKANGFQIGSHTASHVDLTKKRKGEDDQAYMARIKRELLVSKQILDKKLRQDTIYLAYPYGRYNQRILAVSDQMGFKLGFSVKRGGNPFFADPLNLKRDQILKKDRKPFTTRLKTFQRFPLM